MDAAVVNAWRQSTSGWQIVPPALHYCLRQTWKHSSSFPTANGQECEKTLVRLASTYREPFRVAAQRREASLPSELLPCVAGVAGSKVHPLHQMSSSSQQACSTMLNPAAIKLPGTALCRATSAVLARMHHWILIW